MSAINKTFFGLLYYKHLTKCGCINYVCNNKNCNKSQKLNRYNEIFYLGNNYIGKFDYKYLNNHRINSKITILHNDLRICYRERLNTMNKIHYSLYLNKYPIMFVDLPIDLVEILVKKQIIMPR